MLKLQENSKRGMGIGLCFSLLSPLFVHSLDPGTLLIVAKSIQMKVIRISVLFLFCF